MADVPITSRVPLTSTVVDTLEHYTSAALTAGTVKYEWTIAFKCRILDVIIDSETVGVGGTSNIFDVNVNGTTIYTTQANRPTLLLADTGMYTEAGEPEIRYLNKGDVVSYDVDQVTTTGAARTKVCIVLGMPA